MSRVVFVHIVQKNSGIVRCCMKWKCGWKNKNCWGI